MPQWTICIPTIPRRAESLARLLGSLLPQTEAYHGAVTVVCWLNTGAPRLAEIRDAMLAYAEERTGPDSYVSFVDDDDELAQSYVLDVMGALRRRPAPEHVGFLVEYVKNGVFQSFVEHSFRHTTWWHDRDPATRKLRLYRDFTHIDPMRIATARAGRFASARQYAMEDRAWCREVRAYLAASHRRTEVFIPKPLYRYLWTPALSAWDAKGKATLGQQAPIQRPVIDHPNLIWNPGSL
jgi:hypothetical protein